MKKLHGILFIALLGFSGCGYRLVGTGSMLPSHIKTLSIPVFNNVSTEPAIHRNLTEAIRLSFQNDGRLKQVSKRRAHLVINGTLKHYELRPIAFSKRDVAIQYWVILNVDIDVFDQVKKRRFMEQKLETKWNYDAPQEVVDAEAARLDALELAYENLARQLVSMVIDQF
ncbi:MAG: LPS assembly lipoprotein LptE [Nitrospinota bacterium]|nr:LPS assembly lipoprotein LptE [Nitrospinota bacterium]